MKRGSRSEMSTSGGPCSLTTVSMSSCAASFRRIPLSLAPMDHFGELVAENDDGCIPLVDGGRSVTKSIVTTCHRWLGIGIG